MSNPTIGHYASHGSGGLTEPLVVTAPANAISNKDTLLRGLEAAMEVIVELTAQRDRLAEELVEARKPDCRTCARLIQEADGPICSRAWVTRDICVDWNHYEYQPSLVRLYEKEGKV